jgi:hypothetical protein
MRLPRLERSHDPDLVRHQPGLFAVERNEHLAQLAVGHPGKVGTGQGFIALCKQRDPVHASDFTQSRTHVPNNNRHNHSTPTGQRTPAEMGRPPTIGSTTRGRPTG